jgi:pyruvate/2-oxoglutarate dehydrogenase complex dihydrolipoamide acyltransferase (E2) component
MVSALEQCNMPSRDDYVRLADRMANMEFLLDDMDARLRQVHQLVSKAATQPAAAPKASPAAKAAAASEPAPAPEPISAPHLFATPAPERIAAPHLFAAPQPAAKTGSAAKPAARKVPAKNSKKGSK